MTDNTLETATIANGCFWCTEAVFTRLKGVTSVLPGYSGGEPKNPSYEQVSSGTTGHAEAIQITFDPTIISYDKILEIFWHTHNPTTVNQQGNDIGTQYRSAIFYHDEKQKEIAEKSKDTFATSGTYKDPTLPAGRQVVTEIVPFKAFYEAENYHHDYYEHNKNKPYCTFVITPKVSKLLKEFGNDVKDEYKE